MLEEHPARLLADPELDAGAVPDREAPRARRTSRTGEGDAVPVVTQVRLVLAVLLLAVSPRPAESAPQPQAGGQSREQSREQTREQTREQSGEPRSPAAEDGLEQALRTLERGDVSEAERLFRRRLISAPDDARALVGWARALEAQDRKDEAATGLLRAGERALRRGDSSGAAGLLEVAAGLAPERGELWARYGNALLLEQRHLEAEEALRHAIRLSGDDPSIRLQMAAASWENGHLEEAEAHYRRVTEGSEHWPVGWYQLGRFLVWQGRFQEALGPLERSIGLGLEGVDVLLERARALDGVRGSGSDPETARRAVEAWKAVVERAPDEAFARYGLAQALRAAGEREAAGRELEAYAALYARDQERTRRSGLERARIDAARAEIRAGRAELALERLDGLDETVEVLELRARAEVLLGRPDRARPLLERALALEPGRSDLRQRLDALRAENSPG